MFRKLLVVAAAIAMPVSIVAVSGGMAGASNPHTAATDTLSCTKITGTVSFSPALTLKGYTSGVTTTTVKATVTGCTAKGATTQKITSGTASGTIKSTKGKGGSCTGLTAKAISDAGALTIKWAGTPAAPSSVLNLKSVAGGTKNSHGTFTIPGTIKGTATGSFLGANKGASDKTVAQTTETTTQLAAACKTGLKSLAIETEPGAVPLTLG
jgi:hypothetical protein